MKPWTAFAILLIAASIVACAQETPQSPDQRNTGTPGVTNIAPSDGTAGSTPTNTTPEASASGKTVEINMTAENFAFTPNTITVQKGDRVIIRIVGSDDEHGFAIQGYDAQMTFGPGNEGKSLEFIADKAGTFTFYCDVPCGPGHRTMTGQLIVEA